MQEFLDHFPLALTPLSPIHIGCGEDFDPTGYVIEDGVLYAFDPAQAELAQHERNQLMQAVSSKGDAAAQLRLLRGLLYGMRASLKPASQVVVPVSEGIQRQYQLRLKQPAQQQGVKAGRENNQLQIERHAYNPVTGKLYLPGSSLKGALRTAVLNFLNRGQPKPGMRNSELQKELLGGAFQHDPFRLVKISDAQGEVAREVMFCHNRKRERVLKDGKELVGNDNLSLRRELLSHGQYRALSATLVLHDLGPLLGATDDKGKPLTPSRHWLPESFENLARIANAYYRPRLERELKTQTARGFMHPGWAEAVTQLLAGELGMALESGRAMLLRVGRNSGADNVTLDGIASIRILRGRGAQADFQPHPLTWWFAGPDEAMRNDLLPLGWLLVEPAQAGPLAEVETWCRRQPRCDLSAAREQLHALRKQLTERRAARLAEAAERAAREAEEAEAAARQATLRATLSDNLRQLTDLVELFERTPVQRTPGSELFARCWSLLESAQGWGEAEQREVAARLAPLINTKLPNLGKREKEIKAALRRLRGEP